MRTKTLLETFCWILDTGGNSRYNEHIKGRCDKRLFLVLVTSL